MYFQVLSSFPGFIRFFRGIFPVFFIVFPKFFRGFPNVSGLFNKKCRGKIEKDKKVGGEKFTTGLLKNQSVVMVPVWQSVADEQH